MTRARRSRLRLGAWLAGVLAWHTAAGEIDVVRTDEAPPSALASLAPALAPGPTELRRGGLRLATLWVTAPAPASVGSLAGLLRLEASARDARSQELPPGLLTLRYARPPNLKDHAELGVAGWFLLAATAAGGEAPEAGEAEAVLRSRALSRVSHPLALALGRDADGGTSAVLAAVEAALRN